MEELLAGIGLGYPQLRAIHIGAVLLSGALFLVRGVALEWAGAWAMATPVRFASYAIDTVLLAAALALVALLPGEVFANGWLTVKLALLVAYIVAGSVALKRGRTRMQKRLAFGLALSLYAAMFLVARAHDPMAPVCALVPAAC